MSGYHIREAGSTAVQELAFTLADGLAYVELGMRRGLDVDAFAPRLSFFFNAHIDLFEEIAKYRAARRIWARWLRDRYGATRRTLVAAAVPRADRRLLAHGRAARQQRRPHDASRRSRRCSAGRSRCTPTRSTRSLALPTDRAVRIALRTQQVIAYETGVPDVIDPLGGSYLVESLTDRVEAEAETLIAELEAMGDGSVLDGVLAGVETGFQQARIADAAFEEQRRFDAGELVRVGRDAVRRRRRAAARPAPDPDRDRDREGGGPGRRTGPPATPPQPTRRSTRSRWPRAHPT